MKTAIASLAGLLVLAALGAAAGEAAPPQRVNFSAKPSAAKDGDRVKISFTLAAPTDVEVAVLGADGKVVRHLAAGVLGAQKAPPEPLKAGLAQELSWDGKDDFGKPATGGPFRIRVLAYYGEREAGGVDVQIVDVHLGWLDYCFNAQLFDEKLTMRG